jgi:PAS domain S-box-containing protein
MVEASPVGMVVVDRNGQITFANHRAETILGLTRSDITARTYNQPAWKVAAPDGSPLTDADLPFSIVKKTGQNVEDLRHTIERPDGTQILLSVNAEPLLAPDGQFDGMVATIADITEQHRTSALLRESEERARRILETMPLGMHHYRLTPEGSLVFIGYNPAADRILHVDHRQFVNREILDAFPSLKGTEIPDRYREVATSGTPWTTEHISYQDERITGAFFVVAFQTAPGTVAASFLDITERKRAERAIQESEKQFRTIFNSTLDGILLADPDTRNLYLGNAAMCRMLGYSHQEITTLKVDDIHPREETPFIIDRFVRLAQGKIQYVRDIPLKRKDGAILYASVNATPITLHGRRYLMGVFRDTTERRLAEEELRQSRQRDLLHRTNTPLGLIEWDRDFRVTSWNPAAERIFGYAASEVIGRHGSFIIPPSSRPHTDEVWKTLLSRTGGSRSTNENLRKDGTLLLCDWYNTPMVDAEGRVTSVASMVEDITDKRLAEETLIRTSHRLELASQAGRVALWEWDIPSGRLEWSNVLDSMLGYEPGEFPRTLRDWEQSIHPDDQARVAAILCQHIENRTPYKVEYRIFRKDGSVVWWQDTGNAEWDEHGKPLRMAGACVDISDRHVFEDAFRAVVRATARGTGEDYLKRLVQQLASVMDVPFCFIAETRPDSTSQTRIVWAKDSFAPNFRYPLTGTPCFNAIRETSCFHNGTVQRDFPQDHLLLEMKVDSYAGVRLQTSSGAPLGVLAVMDTKPFSKPDLAIPLLQVFADRAATEIERQRTGAELNEESEFRRAIIDGAAEGLCVCHDCAEFPYVQFSVWNSRMTDITGYNLEEINRLGWYQSLYPDPGIRERARLRMEAMREGRNLTAEEWPITRKDGTQRIIAVSTRLLADARGKPHVLGMMQDLTEQKRAESEIHQLNEMLEQKVIERTAQLEAINRELEAFSYSVSHDLRAPLRAIDGFSQALIEDCSAELGTEGRKHLDTIRRSTQLMGQLIDGLLQLSRASRREMHRQTVDLSEMATGILSQLQQSAPARKVTVRIQPGLTAKGDPYLLQSVMQNLLDNAWKFTSKTAEAEIDFALAADPARRVFQVRDNGDGFDMRYADKLFGVFQRLHMQTDFPGTGIGLATVRRIILRHGGEIWAESQPGHGATFRFTLEPEEPKP